MAFNLQNMTVDYKSLMGLIPTERMQLAQSGQINDIISAMTPGQLVSMFPRYYREQLPDVGQINQYTPSLDVALSGGMFPGPKYKQNAPGKDFYSPIYPEITKTETPEDKAVNELFQKAFPNQYGSGATAAITDRNGRVISTASTNLSPQERALLDTISMGNVSSGEHYWESPDYNTIVGGGKFASFEDHPRVFGTSSSTAAGRYQFTKTTWDDVVTRYNKKNPDNPITDFSPTNQDRAALFLARERYATNTGRDLDADLASPPPNMGELIRVGLGRGPKNLTWEAFVKKTDEEVQAAFESNYERNIGYVKDIEAAANQVKDLETVVQQFDPSMIGQLDQRLQTWYQNASEIQKKKFETAIEKLGVDQFNEVMKKQPVNTATLGAVTAIPLDETRIQESQAGFRQLPIKPELKNALEYAAEKSGLYVDIFSGGQDMNIHNAMEASGKNSSYRHNVDIKGIPGAADVILHVRDKNGKLVPLSVTNPEHAQYIAAFTENFSRVVPSAGVGANYMLSGSQVDPRKIHYGGPNAPGAPPATWGSMPDYLQEAHARGVAARAEDLKNDVDPLKQWEIEKQKQKEEKLRADAEARAQASPVSATQNQIETTDSAPPALATGGTIPPGENIAGVNMDTGKIEFVANDRERIRVDPATLENVQQPAVVTPEDTARLQAPVAPVEARRPQSVPQDMNDPKMFEDIAVGYTAMPPSQVRATNRAKLYGEDSLGIVNGHFA